MFITNPKYTPAITIVLDWRRLLIGVGAFISLRSHELKGNWADLEKRIIKRPIAIKLEPNNDWSWMMVNNKRTSMLIRAWLLIRKEKIHANKNINIKSPNLLKTIAFTPAFILEDQ